MKIETPPKIFKTKRNNEIIAKDSYLGRKKEKQTDAYKKDMESVQKNEYTAMNMSGEGYCYGCSKIDVIFQNLFYICTECYQKRGKKGLHSNIIKKEIEELCDLCGYEKFGVWQRNVALCPKCINRVDKFHKLFQIEGKQELANNPFHSRLRRKHGTDWRELTGINV